MSKYNNIDRFYEENAGQLLHSDDYRLCKSIPRDIKAYVEKFIGYYEIHKSADGKCYVSEDVITTEVLDLRQWSDVVTTAKRIMKELDFLIQSDDNNYFFTKSFKKYVESGIDFNDFLMDKLGSINSMKEMRMLLNSIICTLREGYLYGNILCFPDSAEKFKKSITNKNDRYNFRKRVFDLYGFAGRYHDFNRDDYTPNANYRILAVLRSLDFIVQIPSDFDGVTSYALTNKAMEYLDKLNKNLGKLTEQDFERMIQDENDFEVKLRQLAAKYGVKGTIEATHQVRLPQVQEAFRDRLIERQGCKCLLCDVTNKDLLIASHIRRAADEDIYGKADYNNGLLLCAMHDRLFDKYLISFNCLDGKIMLSKTLTDEELNISNLNDTTCLPIEILTPERMEYLMDHNDIFYKKESER